MLRNHILDWCFDSGGLDSIELTKREAKEAAGPRILDELGGEMVGKLDSLIFDGQAANRHIICPNGAGCGGLVTIGDTPGRPGDIAECGGLCGVEDGVIGLALGLNLMGKLSGPDLVQ
jgi:hypothetical protein